MTTSEIRQKFLDFFEDRGHVIVPSSSLVPEDPSVLFTTAGMQQFKRYYTGELDPMRDFDSLNTASVQKSMRTSDIDEVGDESHLTFFEMLGNFSFGGYFKKDAIKWGYEFIVTDLGLKIDYVSIFGGEDGVPTDEESEKIWKSIDPNIEIRKFGKEDNFWGPTGSEGPCGPTTEIYVDGVEVWNIVFNEYYCQKDGTLEPLKTKGVDTGMGLERLVMVTQGKSTLFDIDTFVELMSLLPKTLDIKKKRVIADHLRGIAFMSSEDILPSNKDRGYVLRKLMRRVIVYSHLDDLQGLAYKILEKVIDQYSEVYPELNSEKVLNAFKAEEEKFGKTLKRGLKELDKVKGLDASAAFRLYESYGLPYEIIKEVAGSKASDLTREAFDEEFKKHQAKSREGSAAKFGGHGLILDTGELKAGDEEELKKVLRLHTATHMLQAAIKEVLGKDVRQDGSDITPERLRFDFTFPRKLTDEEKQKIEDIVNENIKKDLDVWFKEMSYEEAMKLGALSFFKNKYPEIVKVYTVGDKNGNYVFSRELCGGPHVEHTGEIGKFKIAKEQALSSGSRRIRAIVE
ncbi:MAG: alanine--tRNA ligase [Parcubacteria group bacterium]